MKKNEIPTNYIVCNELECFKKKFHSNWVEFLNISMRNGIERFCNL